MRRGRADWRDMGAAAAEDGLAVADLTDPTPDVQELFRHYDALYFRGALAAADFAVQWGFSPQSSSFGSCTFSKPRNTITLFEPVLKYRSCTDLKKALLHEMIHAIIYVKHHRKDNQHGPVFRAWMDAINSCSIKDPQRPVSGYNITTCHDFKPEKPFSFKGLLWKCKLCGDTLPRAAKMGPPSDDCCIENVDQDATCGNMLCDWHKHKSECGGSYERMGLQTLTPVQMKARKGTQLLLTYPSQTSKSKQAIQESNSAGLQGNTEVTKPNAEDKHIFLSSLMKETKRCRSEVIQKASVLAVDPPKEVNRKQDLVAMEKDGLFFPEGCSGTKSRGSSSSKKTGKQHNLEDVQKPNVQLATHLPKPKLNQQLVPAEKYEPFSLEGCSNGKSLESKSLQKTGKRRRSEVVGKASALPDELPKETNRKQPLVATEGFFSPRDCDDATPFGNGTLKKASKQHKAEYIQQFSIMPAVLHGKPNQNLVPTETHNLFSLEDCNDAKTPGIINAKKAGKQPKLEDVQSPSDLPAAPQRKPKLTQKLVKTEEHEFFSLEAYSYAKSQDSNTSKQADEQQKPKRAQKACSQHAYPLRRLKKDLVATEKNELFHVKACSHEKLLDKSSKKACKKHEPEDIQKVPGCKPKDSQKQQRYGRRQPTRKKKFAVMCKWMNIYESDRSSDSIEPLVNKRTERRKRERERIQIYARSKKAYSAPLGNSSIDVLVSSHKSGTGSSKGELVQQSRPPPPCSHIVLPITAGQVVTQATGGHCQTSAPCLDIVPQQPADAPDSIPPDSTIIDISDDD